MRQAGTISDKQDAQRFGDYLLAQGISNKIDPAGDGWAIWVRDENQIERSREELARFQAEPTDPRYTAAAQTARQARRQAEQKQKQAERNYHEVRRQWESPLRGRPVTITLIVISIVVFLNILREFGIGNEYLTISNVDDPRNPLPEVQAGQVWRLITPIFMHAGALHLTFNMFWVYSLGTLIERTVGSLRFLMIVLISALASNLLQFAMQGPYFLGMSGVVYGLFGYAWMRGRLDPTCGLWLNPDVALWMFGWFALCLTGFIGRVANWAHGGGLVAGIVLGYLAFTIQRMRRKR